MSIFIKYDPYAKVLSLDQVEILLDICDTIDAASGPENDSRKVGSIKAHWKQNGNTSDQPDPAFEKKSRAFWQDMKIAGTAVKKLQDNLGRGLMCLLPLEMMKRKALRHEWTTPSAKLVDHALRNHRQKQILRPSLSDNT